MPMDSMMYTKEGEFDVALSGGSPWGFTIRTQSGNGYNRGRVIVAKVVQGGKADSSGNIHVGDEILAVNGFEFDNEQQATEYVKVAKKELVLKVKRGQDKRRMNIRLASELPNYFAKALESPNEKNVAHANSPLTMFSDNDNNKRSSKEFEKDLSYKTASYAGNTVIDYQVGQMPDVNQAPSMRSRSSTDLTEYTSVFRDQHDFSRGKRSSSVDKVIIQQKIHNPQHSRLQRQFTWSGRGSPPWKSYNPPASPDKVQRVRIRSTNVTSPDHYKCSPGNDKSSSSFDEDQKQSDNHPPTSRSYSPNGSCKKPSSSTTMEDLNRTWPSVVIPDVPNRDFRLAAHKSLVSVSAAKLQFEQMARSREHDVSTEKERRLKSPLPVPPKPPSRNSSFRSSRLSSSSAVFSDNGADQISPSSLFRHGSFSALSPEISYDKELNTVSPHDGSSTEDLDKPLPPRRYSQSKVLTSFRSNKKPPYLSIKDDESAGSSTKPVYYHGRTQSLPSSKLTAIHLSSKSWVSSRESNIAKADISPTQRLPRSSSFSRARVIETSSVKTVHRDEPPPIAPKKSVIKNYSKDSEPDVIQAFKTGEISSKSTKEVKVDKQNTNDNKTNTSVPVLKENSIMQRLLMESQGQNEPGVRSKAAAIKQEINQRSEITSPIARPANIKKGNVSPIEDQRPVPQAAKKAEDRVYPFRHVSEVKTRKETERVDKELPTKDIEIKDSKDIKQSAAKVDTYFDKLMVKLDSPPLKERPAVSFENDKAHLDEILVEKEEFPKTVKNKVPVVEKDPTPVAEKDPFPVVEKYPVLAVEKDDIAIVEQEKTTTLEKDKVTKTETVLIIEEEKAPILEKDKDQIVERGNISIAEQEKIGIVKNQDILFEGKPAHSSEKGISEPDISSKENDGNGVKVKAPPIEKNNNIEENDVTLELCSDNGRQIDLPSPEVIVQSEEFEIVESCPSTFAKDINDETTKDAPEKTETEGNIKPKTIVGLKDDSQRCQLLSPGETSVKIIHSRENSASSLLEETLESAKTIASIYSVEGPTRSADEDLISTASEMRRYSLAKRRVRKKQKPENESPLKKSSGQGLLTPDKVHNLFNDPGSPVDETEDENGNKSTGSMLSRGSRPNSGILSPKLEVLEEQKELLISSMKKKVELLKEQENEINEEMKQNDELGSRVADDVKNKTSGTEYSKLELFIGELNNIIGLLLSLTQRMHRYEIMLEDIDLAEENGREKRDNLLKRIERVRQQYDEACTIKEINDKRGETVAKFVEEYCSDEVFADFQHFVDMKTQLALTQAEIRDKIKLGEEKLNALTSASIDWGSFDLNSK